MTNQKTVAIALSGGAAKGFAHLGVLQALEEHNMKPVAISGSSAGAIAAAFYADGYSPVEILKLLSSFKLKNFFSLGFIRSGLMKTSGIFRILKTHLRAENIESLQIPTWICVTNLNKGKAEYYNSGNLTRYVLASASIPVLFRPVVSHGIVLADGGICDNLPIEPLKKLASSIFAVNVNPVVEQDIKPSIKSIAERTFVLSLNSRLKYSTNKPDLLFEPEELAKFSYFNIKNAEKMFEIGYDHANEKLKEYANRM